MFVLTWSGVVFYIYIRATHDDRFITLSIFLASGTLLNRASGTNQFLLELVVAAPGQWNYFEVRIDAPTCKLQISANPAGGDPDLFVSTTLQRPNSTSCRAAPAGTCVISDNVRADENFSRISISGTPTFSHHDAVFSSLFFVGLDVVAIQYGGDSIVFDTATVGVYFVGIVAAGSPTTYFAAAAAPIACPPPPPVGPPPRIGSGTILMLVILGVACLLALVGAFMWWQRRQRKRGLSQGFAILGDDVSSTSAASNANGGALTEDSYARLDRPPIIAMDS